MAAATHYYTVALMGNPNSGKSSVFNRLTGLRQKVGNFPGVTVEKKSGELRLDAHTTVNIIDFPGAYSLYPNSLDERIVVQTLLNRADDSYPDRVVYVADVTRLEKHLLLFTQLHDLGLPLILALNMADVAAEEGLQVDIPALSAQLQAPVVLLSSRTGQGFEALEELLRQPPQPLAGQPFYTLTPAENRLAAALEVLAPATTPYQRLVIAHHIDWLPWVTKADRLGVQAAAEAVGFQPLRAQVDETMRRYDWFTPLLARAVRSQGQAARQQFSTRLDRILTHAFSGPLIFLLIMLLVFQAIYAWASYPMDAIDWLFASAAEGLQQWLPAGWLSSLLVDGILAGLGGIVVFVPQIALLFLLIGLLEEVGYMARAAFMFDRLMQFFGLNGRSMVALISGGACAIPAIMSARTIGNHKERLITILVTPFISCSARIPVYTVLIGFVAPPVTVWGFLNLQGLAFMGLYLLGILAALLFGLIFKYILRSEERSYLMLELPEYRPPVWRNVGLTVWEKVKTFVVEAGKIILVISVILWALSSYGPGNAMEEARAAAARTAATEQLDADAAAALSATRELEASYAGHMGKLLEPAIAPLGFDWRIGIALITSFAAREVFVGTMSTIYSLGDGSDELTVRDRLAAERHPETGEPFYNLATSLSLLLFYVFAMMCMSTLAVVKRETGSWRWPILQFVFMTGLAYLSSLLVYQWLS